jgi:hypothetical protein
MSEAKDTRRWAEKCCARSANNVSSAAVVDAGNAPPTFGYLAETKHDARVNSSLPK